MDGILRNAESKMNKAIEILQGEYNRINAGRAAPALLDKVLVNYYDTPTKISQLASISVKSATTLVISPFDPSILPKIEKAIFASNLGVNPQNDSKAIFVSFPPPTEERRKVIVKDISRSAENTRISIRNIRRDALDKLKKMNKTSEITEDVLNKVSIRIQSLTDKYVKKIDSVLNIKQQEIMTV